jgi:hypothetical protein
MNRPLFFHVKSNRSVTFCTDIDEGNNVYITYAIVHPHDQFNRKIGKQIAEARMHIFENIIYNYSSNDSLSFHPIIGLHTHDIVKRTLEIKKRVTTTPVTVFIMNKNKEYQEQIITI